VSEVSSDDISNIIVNDMANNEAHQPLSIEQMKAIRKQKFRVLRVKAAALALSLNAGDVLESITPDTITPVVEEIIWKEDPELLCSYTFQGNTNRENNVYVPGAPPKWTPPTLPRTLSLDRGFQCLDHNHGRSPEFPYEPMFCALETMNPKARLDEIDIIADRNNLRNLLRFIQGKTTDPFRLDLQLVNNTLFLTRKDARFWQNSSGLSYGFNFERHFTQPAGGMHDATAHYRVIRYKMGTLNLAVRFEADAYYEQTSSTDDVERSAVQASAFVDGGPKDLPRYRRKIQVIEKGHSVPSYSIAELKTCPHLEHKSIGPAKWMDQLWFGRTSHFFMGVYEKGTGLFLRFRHAYIRDSMPSWEAKMQTNLQKLTALLSDIRTIVRNTEGPMRAAVLVREEVHGPIMIRAMKEKKPLVPFQSLLRHWDTTEHSLQVQAPPKDGHLLPIPVSYHSGSIGVRPLKGGLAITSDRKRTKVLSLNEAFLKDHVNSTKDISEPRAFRRPVRNQILDSSRRRRLTLKDTALQLLSFLEPLRTGEASNGTEALATAHMNPPENTSQLQSFKAKSPSHSPKIR
jgi:hypothetical protein